MTSQNKEALGLKQVLSQQISIPRLTVSKSLFLEKKAKEIKEQFGGAPSDVKPPQDYLGLLQKWLTAIKGDLSSISLNKLSTAEYRQLKILPWILWDPTQKWSEQPELVKPYLNWADDQGRLMTKRLWRHYLLNLDPQSYATKELASWLAKRQDRLTDSLRTFSKKWQLFKPGAAIDHAASVLLKQKSLLGDLEALNIKSEQVLESSFLLRVLIQAGSQLHKQSAGTAELLKKILEPLDEQPVFRMQGTKELQLKAQRALVEGVVNWASRQPDYQDEALAFINFIIGDPRLHNLRWDHISPQIRQIVEGWLTRLTLDAFLEVMGEFVGGNTDMVKDRKAFWRRYQNSISRAWLITAINGEAIARKRLDKSFGKFAKKNLLNEHIGLLMQIRDLVILEMSQNGRTLFWSVNNRHCPEFYRQGFAYNRNALISNSEEKLTHQGYWQGRYQDYISYRTGILPD